MTPSADSDSFLGGGFQSRSYEATLPVPSKGTETVISSFHVKAEVNLPYVSWTSQETILLGWLFA